jgi:aldose 1-epimerase
VTVSPPVKLSAGSVEVQLAPDEGGSIVAFRCDTGAHRRDLFKAGDDRYPSSFVMLPFVGRIRDGLVTAARQSFTLEANLAGQPHPIHGYGWQRPWQVRVLERTCALLEYRHEADEWPFTFVARQYFELDKQGLSVLLSLENLSRESMPYSLGIHPFFSLTDATSIRAEVDEQWEMDAQVFPVRHRPEEIGLKSGVLASQRPLDTVFSHWRNKAVVDWPEWQVSLAVSSPDLHHLVIWTPPGETFFGLEPISSVPGEFALLAPGAVRLASIRFDIVK